MKMTVPSKTGLGDLESSWAYIGTKHHILTICYAGGCENSTLTRISPNHVDFPDNRKDTVHLMRITSTSSPSIETGEMLRNQGNITTLYHNGQLQADSQNYTGAQSLYQKALEIDLHDMKVLADMGRVLYHLKNYTGAISILNKAIAT